MVVDILDKLHDEFPGCEILGFADLATRMMLITNTGTTLQREDLDALCAEAAVVFGPKNAPALGDTDALVAYIATPDNLRIYLRDLNEPGEALCCVCSYNVPVDRFLQNARACLEQISHGA